MSPLPFALYRRMKARFVRELNGDHPFRSSTESDQATFSECGRPAMTSADPDSIPASTLPTRSNSGGTKVPLGLLLAIGERKGKV